MDNGEQKTRTAVSINHSPVPSRMTSNSTGRAIHDSDQREATELGPVDPNGDLQHSSIPSRGVALPQHWHDDIQRFWARWIHLAVPHADCRDHLANERTFLAYQRTALALSMIGVVTSQLFNLQRQAAIHPEFGYFTLGKPLGALFQCAAFFVTIVGAHRFWRQQINMARGKVWAGGWEIYAIMVAMFLLVGLIFALLITVDVKKEY